MSAPDLDYDTGEHDPREADDEHRCGTCGRYYDAWRGACDCPPDDPEPAEPPTRPVGVPSEPRTTADYDPLTHTFWALCGDCGAFAGSHPTIAAAFEWQRNHPCEGVE